MASDTRIFLAHAREDEARVRDLYGRLKERGFDPWLDKFDLIPGQLWKDEIPKAIASSGIFLACLSKQSVQKQSYVQREFRTALSAYADRPAGSIYLIPVRLDDCEVPDLRISGLELGLTDIHWVDLFEEDGFERLVSAITLAFSGEEPPPPPKPSPSTEAVETEAVAKPAIPEEVQDLAKEDARLDRRQTTPPPPSPGAREKKPTPGRSKRASRNPVIVAAVIGAIATVVAALLGSPLIDKMFGQEEKPSAERTMTEAPAAIEPAGGPPADQEPGEIFRDCDHCPEMVMLPAGSFMMGSPAGEEGRYDNEGPQHEVMISVPFALGKTEVTFEDYDRFAEATGRDKPNDKGWGRGQRPVIHVNWDDAKAYCGWLGEQTSKRTYRLPSKAEWEYAARARTTEATYAGDLDIKGLYNAPVLDAIAWYGGNSGVDFEAENGWDSSGWPEKQYPDSPSGTHPVGKKAANPWGLHDMLGNVWEWTEDWHHNSYEGAPGDGSAWLTPPGTERVVRGGSWDDAARVARAAIRGRSVPGGRSSDIGFRCAGVQGEA